MKRGITQAIIALTCFILYLASSLYFDALNSKQTYIFNYEWLFEKSILILCLVLMQSILYFMMHQIFIFYPFLSIVSSVLFLDIWLIRNGIDYMGFYWSINASLILYGLELLIYFILIFRFCRKYVKWQWSQHILLLLPMLFFYIGSYLQEHDFFKLRPGTYPVYQDVLQQSASPSSKTMDEFLFTPSEG